MQKLMFFILQLFLFTICVVMIFVVLSVHHRASLYTILIAVLLFCTSVDRASACAFPNRNVTNFEFRRRLKKNEIFRFGDKLYTYVA